MGASGSTSIVLRPEEIEELQYISQFSRKDIKKLYYRFRKLDTNSKGLLSEADLMRIPELAMNPLADRVIAMFNFAENGGRINFLQFVKLLSVFNKKANRDHKLEAAFNMFDIDGDGEISKDELFTVLKRMVGNNIEDEELDKITIWTIEDADSNKDGTLCLSEFKDALINSNLPELMTIDMNYLTD